MPNQKRSSVPEISASRRKFLATFALGASAAPLLSWSRGLFAEPAPAPQAGADLCYSNKRVLMPSDFQYLGAMRLPRELSPFSTAALTARRVNNRLQFFMTGENSPNAIGNWGTLDPVFEFADTESYNTNYAQAPRATVLTQWRDIYHGKRASWKPDGTPITFNMPLTRALLWKNGFLYWAYNDGYNVVGRHDWCIGLSDLSGGVGNVVAHGPWRPDIGVKHTAGWLIDMPDGSLGAGFTLSSGNIGSSWGPELNGGARFPTPSTPAGYGTPDLVFPETWLQYPFPGNVFNPDGSVKAGMTVRSMPRDGNYVWHPDWTGGSGTITEVNPALNRGVGSWTQKDRTGACAYIDLPDKHGLLFASSVGMGHLWYGPVTDCGHGIPDGCGGGQGPHGEWYEPRWHLYDPSECQQAMAQNQPRNLTPAAVFNPETQYGTARGCKAEFGGMYFDAPTRRVFVSAINADASIAGKVYPLLHVFQIS